MQTDDPDNFFRAESAIANEEARKAKAAKTKDLGDPIDTPAKPLALQLRGNDAWIAGSDATIRSINLQNGDVIQVLKGHTGPVTSLALVENKGQFPILVSGSWDKTIKVWNASATKPLLSSTNAHSDFVKSITFVPDLKLLVSSGSDKVIRFWDASDLENEQPLECIGLLSAHSRPVQCLCVDVQSTGNATLYSADTMGVIKIWSLERQYGDSPSCRGTEQSEFIVHRTGVNDMWYSEGQLWTGSTDETVILHYHPPTVNTSKKPIPPITLPKPVKAILPLSLTEVNEPYLLAAYDDVIRVYDVSSPDSPEVIQDIDAHWHDVTALRLWFRRSENDRGQVTVEPYIVSSSLDGTLRKWPLKDLLSPPKVTKREEIREKIVAKPVSISVMTEEEEKELDELLGDD